jgi:hypothetical protein
LKERCGVTVALGGRVRHGDREGTIIDAAGQRLRVLQDGDEHPVVCHITYNMAYANGGVGAGHDRYLGLSSLEAARRASQPSVTLRT